MPTLKKRPAVPVLCFCAVLICVAPGFGQASSADTTLPDAPSVKHDIWQVVRHFPRDQADIFASPVRLPRQQHAVLYVLPFAFAAALIPFDERISSTLPSGHGGISSTISNIGIGGTGATLAALYVYGVARDDAHARETGLLGTESLVDSVLPHAVLSYIFGRYRPFQGPMGEVGEGDFFGHHVYASSFPSAHAIFTWSMATVIADEYPSTRSKLFWYGVGTTVAITRVTARQHFASDVVAGSAVGYLIGRHIFHAHHVSR